MWYLAQATGSTILPAYNTDYQTTTYGSTFWHVYLFAWLIFLIVFIIAGWKIFTKAGEAGWKILIPIYNTIIQLRIVGFDGIYFLLFFLPIVNFVFAVIVAYKLAKAFGYGIGMTILEFIFGIGALIIAFGDSKYLGPDGKGNPVAPGSKTAAPTQNPPATPPAQGPPAAPPSQPTRPLVQ